MNFFNYVWRLKANFVMIFIYFSILDLYLLDYFYICNLLLLLYLTVYYFYFEYALFTIFICDIFILLFKKNACGRAHTPKD